MKTKKTILYKLKEIKPGNIFGHEDLLLNIKRKCRVRTLTVCDLIYINRPDVPKGFPKNELNKMTMEAKDLDLDAILDKIYKQYASKRIMVTFFLHSLEQCNIKCNINKCTEYIQKQIKS